MDCALAESFYGLNDNIEAFAEAENLEIEKPFLQPHDRTPKESLNFCSELWRCHSSWMFHGRCCWLFLTMQDPIVRKNGGSFTRSNNRVSSSSSLLKSAGEENSSRAPLCYQQLLENLSLAPFCYQPLLPLYGAPHLIPPRDPSIPIQSIPLKKKYHGATWVWRVTSSKILCNVLNKCIITGLFKSGTKKFPNFDLVTTKRKSRSDERPLDDAYGVYGLASDEEIDLSGGNSLSWGNRRGKRNKVEEARKVKQWNNLRDGDNDKKETLSEKPMRQKKIRFLDWF